MTERYVLHTLVAHLLLCGLWNNPVTSTVWDPSYPLSSDWKMSKKIDWALMISEYKYSRATKEWYFPDHNKRTHNTIIILNCVQRPLCQTIR